MTVKRRVMEHYKENDIRIEHQTLYYFKAKVIMRDYYLKSMPDLYHHYSSIYYEPFESKFQLIEKLAQVDSEMEDWPNKHKPYSYVYDFDSICIDESREPIKKTVKYKLKWVKINE